MRKQPGGLPGLSHNIDALQGNGKPLSGAERAFFETRFGCDLSKVRIHNTYLASQTASAINAKAFTHGKNIVFGAGHYNPDSESGKRLLAHELTHFIQQNGTARSDIAQKQLIQRQTLPIPEFDEFDPCVIVPGGLPSPFDALKGQKVCGSHAKKLRELLGGKGSKKGKTISCPPGFMPGTATDYKDKCCKITGEIQEGLKTRPTTIHNERNCCVPAQIIAGAFDSRCCPAGTVPDRDRKLCVKLPEPSKTTVVCPPDVEALLSGCICLPLSRQNLLKGICCPLGQMADIGGKCVKKETKPKDKKPPVAIQPFDLDINFKKSRPAPGESSEVELNDGLFGNGRKNLDKLISQLTANPVLKVQLIGRASPEGKADFNMELGKRRALIIAKAMARAGISRSRIANPPDDKLETGCRAIDTGLVSCGEAGATGPDDRQVKARVFPAIR